MPVACECPSSCRAVDDLRALEGHSTGDARLQTPACTVRLQRSIFKQGMQDKQESSTPTSTRVGECLCVKQQHVCPPYALL
jgi:hypothetical protein